MTKAILIIVARLIFAAVFAMAAWFKFTGMDATAGYIASAGFPIRLVLAWLAALFETALIIAFLTGAFFSKAALLAAVHVLFFAFAFHGRSHWQSDPDEFGFFVNHFTFTAGAPVCRGARALIALGGAGRVLVERGAGAEWRRGVSGVELVS
jgi:uncharacterized membrane protein YphA (DoxX/SURF4 family)